MDITQPEIKEVTELSCLYRGIILHEVSMLEIMIDAFIGNHFCKTEDTKRQFLKYVLNSKVIIFENKRILLKKIVDESYPEFENDIPKFHGKLDKIRDVRNNFAHFQVDITQDGIDFYKRTKSFMLINGTKDKVEQDLKSLNKTLKTIRDIRNAIAKKT